MTRTGGRTETGRERDKWTKGRQMADHWDWPRQTGTHRRTGPPWPSAEQTSRASPIPTFLCYKTQLMPLTFKFLDSNSQVTSVATQSTAPAALSPSLTFWDFRLPRLAYSFLSCAPHSPGGPHLHGPPPFRSCTHLVSWTVNLTCRLTDSLVPSLAPTCDLLTPSLPSGRNLTPSWQSLLTTSCVTRKTAS